MVKCLQDPLRVKGRQVLAPQIKDTDWTLGAVQIFSGIPGWVADDIIIRYAYEVV